MAIEEPLPTEAGPRVDMSGLPVTPTRPGGLQVGDITKTRQGKLYLVLAITPSGRGWRDADWVQHVALNHDGTWGRLSQTLLPYVESNHMVVGHVHITVSDPEWF